LFKIIVVASSTQEHAAGATDLQRQEASQLIFMWQQDSLSAQNWLDLPAQLTPVASSSARVEHSALFSHPQLLPLYKFRINLVNGGSKIVLPLTEPFPIYHTEDRHV
jgi:hypothetical protein